VLVKAGQKEEEEFFCNKKGSKSYAAFLNFIGNRIKLKGWEDFDGELDTKGKKNFRNSGKYKIYKILHF
jgi:hypothetical protein